MSDKIIQFPGVAEKAGRTLDAAKTTAAKPAPKSAAAAASVLDADQLRQAQSVLSNLSEDQQKAMQIVMSGMAFVLVGIQPSERGADFFTALHGEAADLRNAQPHLGGVIDRAYTRKGI